MANATTFKNFNPEDTTSARTMLHEAIPITGTIVSGTYADNNIKDYSHKMFQSVYDYPYLSSSANHIFDITCGYSSQSALSKSVYLAESLGGSDVSQEKKINIYNQMAQLLVGYDATGSIREFDQDGNIVAGGTKLQEVFFLNFARLLSKDEIKKGSFSVSFITGGAPKDHFKAPATFDTGSMTLADYHSGDASGKSFLSNSPAGEYAVLYTASTDANADGSSGLGLIYYQAGIAVITASIFSSSAAAVQPQSAHPQSNAAHTEVGFGLRSNTIASFDTGSVDRVLSGTTIDNFANGLRDRLQNVQFNNTTELNSTIYFCRVNHNAYNYSANPTYLTGSRIRVKNKKKDPPVSYITTIGLYSEKNELLAVAKLSEPLKKTPSNEITLRVRLDY